MSQGATTTASKLRHACAAAAFACVGLAGGEAKAQPPAVVSQVETVVAPAFFAPPALPPMFFSLSSTNFRVEGFEPAPFAAQFRLDMTGEARASFKSLWYGGTREATMRATSTRARALRGTAAGIAMTGGLAMMLGGGMRGGRRSGAAGHAPIAGAGKHTAADLGVVMGSGVLLTSVMMASVPLKGGMRRLRPMPIGGRRWGGVAARWRF